MSFFSRRRAGRLDATSADELLAGRGVPADAPAGQHALARVLEIAARPGTEQELAGEVAAAAMFVQVVAQARARARARRAVAAAACALAVGGAAVAAAAVAAPAPPRTAMPARFGIPGWDPAVRTPAARDVPARHRHQRPGRIFSSPPTHPRPPGRSAARTRNPSAAPAANPPIRR